MSSDILVNLHLDKEFTNSRVIAVKEINGCDSSFIVSCVLSHCIKSKKALLVVATHNSLSHYQNVGLKMNYNLQKHIENGLIHFYDLSQDNVNLLMSNGCKPSLEELFLKLNKKIFAMKEKHSTFSIIVDGILHLFDMQYTLGEVNKFSEHLTESVGDCVDSFVLFHCNIGDDESHVMANLLSHKAYTVVDVRSLSSGWSADVSGHVTITHPGQKYEEEHMYTMDLKPSCYLFKLFDRGVKLFAPGTV